MKELLQVLLFALPWPLRRRLLAWCFGYRIHPTASIGFSVVLPGELEMAEGARIGHLTMCKGLQRIRLGAYAHIGNLNWITGFPAGDARYFQQSAARVPQLLLGEHTAVTNRHLIDCTDTVRIGAFTTFAGFRSQILTHSIDLAECHQLAQPVEIGAYCFVGTGSILLAGSALPDYCVLGAGAVLNKKYTETHLLYAGNPARAVKALRQDLAYFHRNTGHVN